MKAQLQAQLPTESTPAAPRRITGRQIFDICVLVVLAAVVYMAMGFNSQARMMPLAVSIPLLLLSIWQTVIDFTTSPKEKKKKAEAGGGDVAKREGGAGRVTGITGTLGTVGWILLIFVMIYLVGFAISSFLYTFLYMKVRSRMAWGISVGVSAGFLIFLYVVLIMALQVQLYD